jgi:hypothetical protein
MVFSLSIEHTEREYAIGFDFLSNNFQFPSQLFFDFIAFFELEQVELFEQLVVVKFLL